MISISALQIVRFLGHKTYEMNFLFDNQWKILEGIHIKMSNIKSRYMQFNRSVLNR